MQTPRTKAKIKENLALLMKSLDNGVSGGDIQQMLFNALSWTADDVEEQMNTVIAEAVQAEREAQRQANLRGNYY